MFRNPFAPGASGIPRKRCAWQLPLVDPSRVSRPRLALLPGPTEADAAFARITPTLPSYSPKPAEQPPPAGAPCTALALRVCPFPWLDGSKVAPRLAEEETRRRKALAALADILVALGSESPLCVRLAAEGEPVCADSPSLVAVFAAKSTATLEKRINAIGFYRRWRARAGLASLSFSESELFRYFRVLAEGAAPPTRAQATREAMHLVGASFEIPLGPLLASSRLKGAATQGLARKRPLSQRSPLTVGMVAALESFVVDEAASEEDRILAGAVLFTLFGRARVGDLARAVKEPEVDDFAGDSSGFIETSLLHHKTARPGAKRALPVTSPMLGVSGRPWAKGWLRLRALHGLDASVQGCLFPIKGPGGAWLSTPVRTSDFGASLRSLLLQLGFPPCDLSNIGAHSLKATTLTWAAKAGVLKETRKALGYHIEKGDHSMAAYSRDLMAGPLVEYQILLRSIGSGQFRPDETRSGRRVALPSVSSESSSSSSGSTSSSPASAGNVKEGEIYILNAASKILHRFCAEDGKLRCGKDVPANAVEVTSHEEASKLCSRCFGRAEL